MVHTVQLGLTQVGSTNQDEFKSSAAFKEIEKLLEQDGASYVKKIKGTYSFKVKNASGKQASWFVDVKDGNGCVSFDSDKQADCTITMGDEDLLGLMSGTLNPQKAFMQGKLKIAGNMALAMKLKDLQPSSVKSKL